MYRTKTERGSRMRRKGSPWMLLCYCGAGRISGTDSDHDRAPAASLMSTGAIIVNERRAPSMRTTAAASASGPPACTSEAGDWFVAGDAQLQCRTRAKGHGAESPPAPAWGSRSSAVGWCFPLGCFSDVRRVQSILCIFSVIALPFRSRLVPAGSVYEKKKAG